MYNRYIPQPDGTYRKNQIQEAPNMPEKKIPAPPPPIPVKEPEAAPCSQCIHNNTARRPMPPREPRRMENTPVSKFLKQLLPKDFDAEDLMVVLLLLLMSGDRQENQNTTLLTLMLYLFL